MGYSVAIDGPAGAGKSTIAKQIAKKMNFIYVDTGAMYRAMALFLLQNHVEISDTAQIEKICEKADITIEYRQGEQVVLLDGENVNGLIRTEEVGNMASVSSANEKVRKKLVALQQKLAESSEVIMDGRDIGTVVLPEADVKVYLTADASVRAKRRYEELTARGESCDIKTIEADIIDRDYRDMHRKISPLKQAGDAVLLDTSYMTIEEVAERIIELISENKNQKK